MATRFYLPSAGTAAASPAFDAAWDDSSSVVRRPANRTKGTSAFAEVTDTEVSAVNTWDVCLGQFVSEPLQAQTITGTVKGIVRARESAAGANARSQMVVRVVSGDGATVRGTLLAQDNTTTNINEWVATTTVTAARNARFPVGSTGATLTSVAAQAGDRIVIEVGARAVNTVATNFTLGLRFGENATDAAENETGVTEAAPWVEFSADLLFAADVLPAAFVTQGRQPQVPSRINWGHPLARGLVFFVIPNQQNAPDLVGGGRGVPLNSTGLAVGTGGVGLNSTSVDNTGWAIPYRADLFHTIATEVTVACHVDVTAQDAYSTLISVPYADNAWMEPFGSLGLSRSGTNTNINLGVSDSATNRNSVEFPNDTFLVGPGQSIMVTRSGTTGVLYRNKVSFGSQFNELSALPVAHGTPGVVVLMNRSNTMLDEGTAGVMYYAAIWNRSLSPEEARSFQENPYQILVPIPSPFRLLLKLPTEDAAVTGTSAATLPKPTAAASSSRTIPARTASSTATLPKPTAAASATRTIPARTASGASSLPKLTATAAAARTIPARTATSSATLPKVTTTAAAARTIPARTASGTALIPVPSSAATGARTIPGRTATSAGSIPFPSGTASGFRTGVANRLAAKPVGTLTLDKSGIMASATGYWAFQEGSGAAVNLATPGTGNASVQAGSAYGSDALGGYLSCAKALNSYASTGLTATALGIGGTAAKTTFCRFSASSQAYANNATLGTYTGALFYCGGGVTNGTWAFRQSSPTNPPSDLWLANLNASPANAEITITPTVDTVHTMVLIWDGSTSARVYVDGALVQTVATALNIPDTRTFDIGRMLPNSGVDADRWHFQGKIYELGVIGGVAWSDADVATYDANPVMGLSGSAPAVTGTSASILPTAQSSVLGILAVSSGNEFSSEFSFEFANGIVTGTSASTLPAALTTATGARTIPARIATGASALPRATSAATATRTIPARTAASAATLPKAISAATATRTIPSRAGTSSVTLPKATGAAAATRTIPNRTATSGTILPKVQSLAIGTLAVSSGDEFTSEFTSEFANGTTPVVGSSSAITPTVRTSATATRTIPARTATSASLLPKATTAAAASRTIPTRTAASASTLPKATTAATATRAIPNRTASGASVLPKVTTVASAARTIPARTATSVAALPKTTSAATATRTIPNRTATSATALPPLECFSEGDRIVPEFVANSAASLSFASSDASGLALPPTTVITTPALFIQHRWQQQPQVPTEIDWSHPLARGLAFFIVGNAENAADLVSGYRAESISTSKVTTGSTGRAFDGSAATTGTGFGVQLGDRVKAITTEMTVACHVDIRAIANNAKILTVPYHFSTYTAPFYSFSLGRSGSGSRLALFMSDNPSTNMTIAPADGAFPVTGNYHLAAVRSGTTGAWYRNGESYALNVNSATANPIVFGTGDKVGLLNHSPRSPGETVNGQLYWAAVWSRALSQPEVREIYRNPYQILKPAKARVYRYFAETETELGAGTSASTLPAPSTVATGSRTIPARTAASGAVVPMPDSAGTSVRTIPVRTAASAATTPKPTTVSSAVRTIPARTASAVATLPNARSLTLGSFVLSSGDEFSSEFSSEFTNGTTPVVSSSVVFLPKPSATATATRTIPNRTATSSSTLPKVVTSATATRTPPVRTAASASTAPKAASAATAVRSIPGRAGTSSTTLPRSTASATALRTIPARTATSSATIPKAVSSASALRTIPSRAGTSAAILPKASSNVIAIRSAPGSLGASPSTLPRPTSAAVAARTIPNRTATSTSILPKPATASTAARTAPGTASSASRLPKVRTAAIASRTIPDLVGTSATVVPFPRSSAAAIRQPVPVTATSAGTLPGVFTVAVGAFDVPLFSAASPATLPRPRTAATAEAIRPQFPGVGAVALPRLGTLAQGHFISPSAADVAGVVFLTGEVVYDIDLTGSVVYDIDLTGEVVTDIELQGEVQVA